MPGRMYSANFRSVSVSAVQDLFELVAAAGVPIIVHEVHLSSRDGSDERLNIMIHRATTSGSGGSVPTPRGLNPGVTTASSTVAEANNTTQGADGNIVESLEWDIRMPMQRLYTPEQRPLIPGGGRLCISLETAPGAARVMSGNVIFEEVG